MSGSLRIAPVGAAKVFRFDDEEIAFAPGDSVAEALVGAGQRGLARSLKYHRRRGPSCLRGACDGCLLRIDGEPNQLACRVQATAGMVISSQNTLGSREFDLLRVTDWFFPDGMNHHELLAGVPGLSALMQGFARRVAGLGTLPDNVQLPERSKRRAVDALVVGSGAAGVAIAVALARQGCAVEMIEEHYVAHAALLAAAQSFSQGGAQLLAELQALASQITVRTDTTAAALFQDELLLVGPLGAEVVVPRLLVFAVGAQDGVLAFEGNDLPGIYSARAACMLLARGIRPGRNVVNLHVSGSGLYAREFAAASGLAVTSGKPVRARGTSAVERVEIEQAGGNAEFACDALVIDCARSPSYELPLQAGAQVALGAGGYSVQDARISQNRYAFGEVCKTHANLADLRADAELLAREIALAPAILR